MNSTLISPNTCPPEGDLKAALDGEADWQTSRRVRRHLHSCAACAEAAQAITLLSQEARRWCAAQTPPEALRGRILSQIEFPSEGRGLVHQKEKPQMARTQTNLKWAGAALVTMALAGWLLLAPQGRHGQILAATVRQALSNVNTWHLHGWKIVEGKRVPWEVWGRRSPFFYREQVGGQIIQDDGAERVQVFPPDPAIGRPAGLVVKTASQPGTENTGWNFPTLFAVWQGGAKPWQETRDQVVFNLNDAGMQGPGTVTDNLYTVDKQTALPVQIEVRRGSNQSPARQTSEFLTAEYDIPLPDLGTEAQWPSQYRVVDAVSTAPASTLPRENTASSNGVTVQVTPLGEDAQGNILVTVHAWLGNVLLGVRPPVFALVDVKRNLGDKADSPPAVYDDQGRGYVGVEMQDGPSHQIADDRMIVLSPLDLLPPQAARPRRLTMTLHVTPAITAPVSGMKRTATSQPLLDENIGLTVSLPDSLAPFDGSRLHGLSNEPLDAQIAMAQADYWINDFDWRDPSDLMRVRALRSIAWRKQAVQLLPAGNQMAPLAHEGVLQAYDELAGWYHNHGDQPRAMNALRALIADSQEPPALPNNSLRKRAEEELQRWTKPQTH